MKTTIKMLLKLAQFSTLQKISLLFFIGALGMFLTPLMPIAEAQTVKYVVTGIGCKEHTNGDLTQISPPGGLVITADSVLFYSKYVDMVTGEPETRAFIKNVFFTDGGVKISGEAISLYGTHPFTIEIKEGVPALWTLPDGHEVALLLVKVQSDK